MKKLYRSEKDSLVAGIIGGIGEYFNVDPTILRLAFIIIVLVTGIFPGIVAYIIAYFIIPDRPGSQENGSKKDEPIVTPPPPQKPTPETKLQDLIEEKKNGTETKTNNAPIIVPPPQKAPETTPEPIPEAPMGELKKPNWPTLDSEKFKVESEKKEEIEYPEPEPETPTLDSLMDEDYDHTADLEDIVDE